METYYKEFDIMYDKQALVEESKVTEFAAFKSGFNNGSWFDEAPTWQQGHVDTSKCKETRRLVDYFMAKLSTEDIRPRFYKQSANSAVPLHADINTKCCVNIMLSDDNGPFVFEDIGKVDYECALLNITKKHEVPAHTNERLLLKFSIFDITYEQALDRIKSAF